MYCHPCQGVFVFAILQSKISKYKSFTGIGGHGINFPLVNQRRDFASMAWSASFVDELCYCLKVLGAPKVGCGGCGYCPGRGSREVCFIDVTCERLLLVHEGCKRSTPVLHALLFLPGPDLCSALGYMDFDTIKKLEGHPKIFDQTTRKHVSCFFHWQYCQHGRTNKHSALLRLLRGKRKPPERFDLLNSDLLD